LAAEGRVVKLARATSAIATSRIIGFMTYLR
jgi:hypothetical protein